MANAVTNNFLPLWMGHVQSSKIMKKFPLCLDEKEDGIKKNLNVFLLQEEFYPCLGTKTKFGKAFVASLSYDEPLK